MYLRIPKKKSFSQDTQPSVTTQGSRSSTQPTTTTRRLGRRRPTDNGTPTESPQTTATVRLRHLCPLNSWRSETSPIETSITKVAPETKVGQVGRVDSFGNLYSPLRELLNWQINTLPVHRRSLVFVVALTCRSRSTPRLTGDSHHRGRPLLNAQVPGTRPFRVGVRGTRETPGEG